MLRHRVLAPRCVERSPSGAEKGAPPSAPLCRMPSEAAWLSAVLVEDRCWLELELDLVWRTLSEWGSRSLQRRCQPPPPYCRFISYLEHHPSYPSYSSYPSYPSYPSSPHLPAPTVGSISYELESTLRAEQRQLDVRGAMAVVEEAAPIMIENEGPIMSMISSTAMCAMMARHMVKRAASLTNDCGQAGALRSTEENRVGMAISSITAARAALESAHVSISMVRSELPPSAVGASASAAAAESLSTAEVAELFAEASDDAGAFAKDLVALVSGHDSPAAEACALDALQEEIERQKEKVNELHQMLVDLFQPEGGGGAEGGGNGGSVGGQPPLAASIPVRRRTPIPRKAAATVPSLEAADVEAGESDPTSYTRVDYSRPPVGISAEARAQLNEYLANWTPSSPPYDSQTYRRQRGANEPQPAPAPRLPVQLPEQSNLREQQRMLQEDPTLDEEAPNDPQNDAQNDAQNQPLEDNERPPRNRHFRRHLLRVIENHFVTFLILMMAFMLILAIGLFIRSVPRIRGCGSTAACNQRRPATVH